MLIRDKSKNIAPLRESKGEAGMPNAGDIIQRRAAQPQSIVSVVQPAPVVAAAPTPFAGPAAPPAAPASVQPQPADNDNTNVGSDVTLAIPVGGSFDDFIS